MVFDFLLLVMDISNPIFLFKIKPFTGSSNSISFSIDPLSDLALLNQSSDFISDKNSEANSSNDDQSSDSHPYRCIDFSFLPL